VTIKHFSKILWLTILTKREEEWQTLLASLQQALLHHCTNCKQGSWHGSWSNDDDSNDDGDDDESLMIITPTTTTNTTTTAAATKIMITTTNKSKICLSSLLILTLLMLLQVFQGHGRPCWQASSSRFCRPIGSTAGRGAGKEAGWVTADDCPVQPGEWALGESEWAADWQQADCSQWLQRWGLLLGALLHENKPCPCWPM